MKIHTVYIAGNSVKRYETLKGGGGGTPVLNPRLRIKVEISLKSFYF